LMLAVSTWVAGFDIIYACQDVEFDRAESLHSMPAKFGIAKSLSISAILHVITVLSFIGLGCDLHLGLVFFGGTAMVAAMLIYEHRLVKPNDLSKVNAAFFTVNGVVSIAAFLTFLIDKIVRTLS